MKNTFANNIIKMFEDNESTVLDKTQLCMIICVCPDHNRTSRI